MKAGRMLFLLTLQFMAALVPPFPAPASAQSGVPHAVWQDSEHKHRRSPSQIPSQTRPQMPLPPDAQNLRTAKATAQIASGAAPLAP
ncbi:MAG: hypothetical protein LBQ10_08800, partial [Desulfovibrio sp.]|nr:hypothetical protein [Desulfovibrio sp.]